MKDIMGEVSELQHLLRRIEIISSIPTVASQRTDSSKVAPTQTIIDEVAELQNLLRGLD